MQQEVMFPASHCWSRNTDPLLFLLYTCVILVSTIGQFSFTLEHHHNLSPKFGILNFFAFVMKLNMYLHFKCMTEIERLETNVEDKHSTLCLTVLDE